MNSQEIENKLLDYLDDLLPTEERIIVESELAKSSELRQVLEEYRTLFQKMETAKPHQPSGNLRSTFDDFLRSEKNKQGGGDAPVVDLKRKNKGRSNLYFLIASAAAILLLGVFIGQNLDKKNDQVTVEQFASLEAKMLNLLEKENSTSGRISAVNISYEIKKPNAEIIDALIQSMNIDKSTNVRLAAMEALFYFADEPKVKTALCESLNLQKNPMIQLSLIQMLVRLKEKQAVEHFEDLIKKSDTTNEVKDEAQMGIFKMM